MNDDITRTLAWLKECLVRPDKRHISDIIQRRIYAIEQDIAFTNPFTDIDETLYAIWRGPIPAPIVMADPSAFFGEIDWDDFR